MLRKRQVWVAMLASAVAAMPLAAQTAVPANPTPNPTAGALPSRSELNPANRLPGPAAAGDMFRLPPPGPCPFAQSDLTLTLNGVMLKGLTGAPEALVRPAWAGQTGKIVPLSELCAIRDRIAESLFRAGLLARVEIPEQRISGGTPVLEVIEASVAGVTVTGDAGPATRIIEDYAERLRGMAPFNLKTAQRYLLLAAEVPGITLRTIVRPSVTGRRGAVDIELQVSRDAVAAVANVQNYQSPVAGRWGALARVDFNSLTELGDRTSLVFYRTLDSNEQFVGQLLEEVRLGGSGLLLKGALAYGESRPGDVLAPLNLRSLSTVASLELAYPVIKRRALNLNVAAGFEAISQRSEIRGSGGRLLNDQLRIAYARLGGDIHPWIGRRQGVIGASVEVRKGLSILGASPDSNFLASRADGRADAFVVRMSAQAQLPLSGWLLLSARGEGQISDGPLLAYDEQPVGTLTIGRGYDPASASGDRGVAGAFEARLGPFGVTKQFSVQPYGFYDVARVTNRDALGSGSTLLASVGGGAQIRWQGGVLIDLVYAQGLDSIRNGQGRPAGRLLVNLTVAVK